MTVLALASVELAIEFLLAGGVPFLVLYIGLSG